MIVTFKEKDNKKYEVYDEHVDEIFEDTKTKIINILEQFKHGDKDLIIVVMAIGCISNELNQSLSNRYGADKLIELTEAIEVKEGD